MTPDQILASQMWAWPGPMLKRDSHGRILVVNAAFLQLYGGTVETWTGNPVSGWPAPKSPGESARFESRIPLPTGGETVYDWMESTLQDGTALAIARDVSIYAQAAQPAPVAEPAPVQTASQPAPVSNESPMSAAPAAAAATAATIAAAVSADNFLPKTAEPAPVEPAPVAAAAEPAPVTEAPAPAPVQEPFTTPEGEKSPVVAPLPVETPMTEAPVTETVVAETPIAEAPMAADPVAPAQTQAPAERSFDKRPLPIEDGDAILGNNWRDAVIAKAVGVEDDAADDGEAAAPMAAPTIGTGEQIRVLLAEDNAINALLTRTLLEAEGCHCDVVEDGALAVEAVKNNQYDLIFMDMRMPNMDGLEATRKIRGLGHDAKVLPIVALTANAFDDDRNACFDSGMNDFMTKPVSAEELSAMVQSHTGLEATKIAS